MKVYKCDHASKIYYQWLFFTEATSFQLFSACNKICLPEDFALIKTFLAALITSSFFICSCIPSQSLCSCFRKVLLEPLGLVEWWYSYPAHGQSQWPSGRDFELVLDLWRTILAPRHGWFKKNCLPIYYLLILNLNVHLKDPRHKTLEKGNRLRLIILASLFSSSYTSRFSQHMKSSASNKLSRT